MSAAALPAETGTDSPCVDLCRMNLHSGLCEGCLRTLDEIAAWSGLGNDERRAVLAQLPARRTPR